MNGKQLKNSILQWAIQGKLVPQDPNDEPASVLLERIRAEKARLVKEGKIKKDKNESIIFRGDDNSHYEKFLATGEVKCIDDEIPFEIPQGWEWCRLGAVLEVSSARRVHEKDWRASGVPFYRAREIGKLADYGYVDNDLFIDKSLYDDFAKSGIPRVGDLMMTAVGTLGKTYVVTDESPFYYKDGSVLCIGNPHCLNPFFIKYYFESSIFSNQYVTESDGTTVATLTMVRLNRYFIPIPPLLEQQRIVDIIKKLAPYITKYEETQSKLNILNNSVAEKLKKSILQDAIQGRLVPQIAEEGTAQELLAQIQQEKARLVKEGKLKKKDITDSVIFKGDDNKYYERINGNLLDISDDIPFDIPHSWAWTHIENITYSVGTKDNQVQSKSIKKEGLLPVVSQGLSLIDGYSDEIQKVINDIPLVMFGDHTRNVKYIDFPFIIGADGTKFHKCILIEPKYLYLWMKATASGLRDRGYARHYTLLKRIPIALPPIMEQRRIVQKCRALLSCL